MINIDLNEAETFFYLDPPYYKKGKSLYLNFYEHTDHVALKNQIDLMNFTNWLISYDNVPEINKIYSNYRRTPFTIGYSLQDSKVGNELLIFPDHLYLPKEIIMGSKAQEMAILNRIENEI